MHLRFKTTVLIITCAVLVFFAATSSAYHLPDGGARLISPAQLSPEKIATRFGGEQFGFHRVESINHPEFAEYLHVHIQKQPTNTWDIGASSQITSAVKKGDLLLVGFWARGKSADGNGGGVAEFVFERNGGSYTKSVQYLVETPHDGKWKNYWVRFRSAEDYAPGEALINFQLGYVASDLDLAGIEAWNFSDTVNQDALPNSELTYVGREPDAPWRAAANERIQRHRTATLRVTVTDKNGSPVANTPIRLSLSRHAFDFGSAVSADMINGTEPDHERYRETFKKHFNLAVMENGLKWRVWDVAPQKQSSTIKSMRWLKRNDIPLRGHVLVWPGHRYLPDWIKPLERNPDVLRRVIDGHIRELGYASEGIPRDWDVLNEVFDNPDLTNVLGDEVMTHWFHQARQVAPNAKLFYNDYAGLVRGGFPTGHKDHFEKTIRYLIDHDAPIDGIGIQSHFGSLLTAPTRLLAELDRWGALGLDVMITEFDVTVPGEQLKADFTRDFLTACFSHPDVDGIVSWGFWSESHWKPEAAFFGKDWQPTKVGQQWIDLTTKIWHTDEKLITDANGQVQLRGFLGDYKAKIDGKEHAFKHSNASTNVRLTH